MKFITEEKTVCENDKDKAPAESEVILQKKQEAMMNIQHYKLNLDLLKNTSTPVLYSHQLDKNQDLLM